MFGNLVKKFSLPLAQLVWSQMSDVIKDALTGVVGKLEEAAKATENKWDDFAVEILKTALKWLSDGAR